MAPGIIGMLVNEKYKPRKSLQAEEYAQFDIYM